MRRWLAILILAATTAAYGAVPKVTITGKVIAPDGLTYAGSINCVMSAPATAMDGGTSVRVQSTGTLTIASDGTVSGALVANDITTPVTSYTCTTRINRTPVYTQTELIYLTTGSGTVDWGAISRPGATPYTPVGVSGSAGALQSSNGSGGLADSGVTATAGALTATSVTTQGTPVSQIAIVQALAASLGSKTFPEGGVFDAWREVYGGHPLASDYDKDGTAGAASNTTGFRHIAIVRCSNTGCANDNGAICIGTSEGTSDGTVNFDNDGDGTVDIGYTVGDAVVVGNSLNTAVGDRVHIITSIADGDGTVCASGHDNRVNVFPAVDQNGGDGIDANADGTMDAGRYMDAVAGNNTHPSGVGADFTGWKVAYAPRMRDGVQGPNLLRNGEADHTTNVQNWHVSTGSLGSQNFSATVCNTVPCYQCQEGNSAACFYYNSTTSGSYIESDDAISLTPGDRIVLSGMGFFQAGDSACIATDPNNTGTWACDGTMTHLFTSTYQNNFVSTFMGWWWTAWEVPEGVHSGRVRFTKGTTAGSYPFLDNISLRAFSSKAYDSSSNTQTAYSAFLIEDPGSSYTGCLVNVAGDSHASSVSGYGTYFKAGLVRGLNARWGRDITSQVVVTGIAGHTTTSMISDFSTTVAPNKCLYTIYLSTGVNDAVASTSVSTVTGNLLTLKAMNMQIGAIPIFVSMPPLGPSGNALMTTSHNYRDAARRALLNGGHEGTTAAGSVRPADAFGTQVLDPNVTPPTTAAGYLQSGDSQGLQFFPGKYRSGSAVQQFKQLGETYGVTTITSPTVAFIGDSITSAWCRSSFKALRKNFGNTTPGYLAFGENSMCASADDVTITKTGGSRYGYNGDGDTTPSTTEQWGVSGNSWNATSAAELKYQVNLPSTFNRVKIFYFCKSGGGIFKYAINGDAASGTSVDTSGCSNGTLGSVSITPATTPQNGDYLDIKWSSGNVTLYGAFFYIVSSSANEAYNHIAPIWLSQGGIKAQDWATNVSSTLLATFLTAVAPTQYVVALGTNDGCPGGVGASCTNCASPRSASQYQSDLGTIVAQLQTQMGSSNKVDVILATQFDRGTTAGAECSAFTTTADAYRTAVYATATTYKASVWDLRKYWLPFTDAWNAGMYMAGDGTHPSEAGRAMLANGWARLISTRRWTPQQNIRCRQFWRTALSNSAGIYMGFGEVSSSETFIYAPVRFPGVLKSLTCVNNLQATSAGYTITPRRNGGSNSDLTITYTTSDAAQTVRSNALCTSNCTLNAGDTILVNINATGIGNAPGVACELCYTQDGQ